MIEESLARVVSARRAVARGSQRQKKWWLIAKNGNSRVEFLTMDREGDCGETSVIFGYEEEAEMFLYLGGCGVGDRTHTVPPSRRRPMEPGSKRAFYTASKVGLTNGRVLLLDSSLLWS